MHQLLRKRVLSAGTAKMKACVWKGWARGYLAPVRACPGRGKRSGALTASGEHPNPANLTPSATLDVPGTHANSTLVLLKPVSVLFLSLAAKDVNRLSPNFLIHSILCVSNFLTALQAKRNTQQFHLLCS